MRYCWIPLLAAAFSLEAATQTITPESQSPMPPPSAENQGTQSYMMIPPAARAADFQQAFEQLRKEKTTGRVYFQLNDGTMISNVIEMTLMANSTLILFRYNSTNGVGFKLVKVEDILQLGY